MSLLEAIRRKKLNLRPSETLVTLPTGQIYKEVLMPNGKMTVSFMENINSPGYVVDTKPDLVVNNILPGLCMGSQDVVQDQALLMQYNITHVLSIGVQAVGLGPEYKTHFIEALDLPETNIIPILEEGIAFIDQARDAHGCVFVHCNAGISRSATVIIGYLMRRGMPFNESLEFLKARRTSIRPNEGFISQLKKYEATLMEKNIF